MPPVNDLKKWNNRVVTNLLYYQTNYFSIALMFVLLSCFIHSQDIIVGASAVGSLAGNFNLYKRVLLASRCHHCCSFEELEFGSGNLIYELGSERPV